MLDRACSAGSRRRLNPYPRGEPTEPPKGLVAFCLHYSARRQEVAGADGVACRPLIAAGEIMLFGFIGDIVNWLGTADRATFLADRRLEARRSWARHPRRAAGAA